MKAKVSGLVEKLVRGTGLAAVMVGVSIAPAHADFNQMFNNLKTQIVGFSGLFMAGVTMTGAGVLLFGLYKGWDMSKDQSRTTMKEVIVPIVVGGCMLAFGAITTMATTSTSGQAVSNSQGLTLQ